MEDTDIRRTKKTFVKQQKGKIGVEDEPTTQNMSRILTQYNGVLDGIGRMRDDQGKEVEIAIKTKPEAVPYRQKFRRYP